MKEQQTQRARSKPAKAENKRHRGYQAPQANPAKDFLLIYAIHLNPPRLSSESLTTDANLKESILAVLLIDTWGLASFYTKRQGN